MSIDAFLNESFLKVVIPAIAAIIAWFLNEKQKVKYEQIQRKEDRYKELLRCLKGFYSNNRDSELKKQFVEQVNLCWLYAPDEIILKTKVFLETISHERTPIASDSEKQKSLAQLILAIRKDMLSRKLVKRTTLSHEDWKSFNAG